MGRNYGRDVLVQGVARIAGGVMSFLAIFIFTYLFDESEIGEYNIILSSINIITTMLTLWLSQSILRFYEDELGTIIVSTALTAVASALIWFFISQLLGHNGGFFTYLYLVIFIFYNIFDALFRRKRKLWNYMLLELLFGLGRLFPMVIIAYYTHDINSVFASQFTIVFIYIVYIAIRNKDKLRKAKYAIDKEVLNKYLKYGMPLIGLSISSWVLNQSDRYVIRYFFSNYEVGLYSTNYSLANSTYMMFALIIVNAFHPIIMNTWDKDKNEAIGLVSDSMDYYLMFMVPILYFGCLKAPIILGLFKGDTYLANGDIFIWTAIGIFVHGLSLLYHKYYEVSKKTYCIFVFNIIVAIVNVILNILLVPLHGFGIASFTTFISYVLYIVLVRICSFKQFPVKFSIKKLMIMILAIFIFAFFDMLICSDSFFIFLVEGVVFVIYIMVVYRMFRVVDIKPVLSKTIHRGGTK